MTQLCIGDLHEIVGGQLRLADMPPLGGLWEPVRRIVLDCRGLRPGDVLWALPGEPDGGAALAELAYMRGCLGVVAEGRPVTPWPGAFSLHATDAAAALFRVAECTRGRFRGSLLALVAPDARLATWCQRVLRTRGEVWRPDRALAGVAETAAALADLPADGGAALAPLSASPEISEILRLCRPDAAVITPPPSGQGSRTGPLIEPLLAALPPGGLALVTPAAADLVPPHARKIVIGQEDLSPRLVRQSRGGLEFRLERQTFCLPGARREDLHAALAAIALGRVWRLAEDELAAALAEEIPAGAAAMAG